MDPVNRDYEEKEVYSMVPTPIIEDGSNVGSFDKDIAATIVPEHALSVNPAMERRVLRKIDMFLIPLMWIGYGFVYYDKAGQDFHLLAIDLVI